MGLRDRLSTRETSDLSSSQNEDVEYTPLASRFYGALYALAEMDGAPSQLSMVLPSLVKSVQRSGLTDEQIIEYMTFVKDFADAIMNEPVEPLTLVAPASEPVPFAPVETPENQGVDTTVDNAV